jgi:hypothetical protein
MLLTLCQDVFKSRLYLRVGGWATFLGIGMFTASDDDWQRDAPADFLFS